MGNLLIMVVILALCTYTVLNTVLFSARLTVEAPCFRDQCCARPSRPAPPAAGRLPPSFVSPTDFKTSFEQCFGNFFPLNPAACIITFVVPGVHSSLTYPIFDLISRQLHAFSQSHNVSFTKESRE